MSFSDIIGAIGVTLLLIAFFLTTFRIIKQKSLLYILLNIIGATLACYASYLIQFIPFIILEGAWTTVALISLIQYFLPKKTTIS